MTLLLSVFACNFSETTADSAPQPENTRAAESTQPEKQETAGSAAVQDKKEVPAMEAEQTRVLVAYSPITGNTRPIAETVAELTGADLFEIVLAEAYTDENLNYSNDGCHANQEQNDRTARPAISGRIENMDDYDIVYLGYLKL